MESMTKKSQSVLEYLIISVVVILAVASVSFVDKVKDNFENHFKQCKEEILK